MWSANVEVTKILSPKDHQNNWVQNVSVSKPSNFFAFLKPHGPSPICALVKRGSKASSPVTSRSFRRPCRTHRSHTRTRLSLVSSIQAGINLIRNILRISAVSVSLTPSFGCTVLASSSSSASSAVLKTKRWRERERGSRRRGNLARIAVQQRDVGYSAVMYKKKKVITYTYLSACLPVDSYEWSAGFYYSSRWSWRDGNASVDVCESVAFFRGLNLVSFLYASDLGREMLPFVVVYQTEMRAKRAMDSCVGSNRRVKFWQPWIDSGI